MASKDSASSRAHPAVDKGGSEQAKHSGGKKWYSWFTEMPGAATAAVSLAGVTLYGVVLFGNAAFYERLGISTDSIGLTSATVLSRVAGPFALLACTLAAVIAYYKWNMGRGGDLGLWEEFGKLAIGFPFLLLLPIFFTPATWYFGIIAASMIIVFTVLFEYRHDRQKERTGFRDRIQKHAHLTVIVVAYFVVASFGVSAVFGYRAADYILKGRELPKATRLSYFWGLTRVPAYFPWVSGVEGFLGIEAKHVKTIWVDPKLRGEVWVHHELFYLGQNQGVDYLYDVKTGNMLRVPESSVVMQVTYKIHNR